MNLLSFPLWSLILEADGQVDDRGGRSVVCCNQPSLARETRWNASGSPIPSPPLPPDALTIPSTRLPHKQLPVFSLPGAALPPKRKRAALPRIIQIPRIRPRLPPPTAPTAAAAPRPPLHNPAVHAHPADATNPLVPPRLLPRPAARPHDPRQPPHMPRADPVRQPHHLGRPRPAPGVPRRQTRRAARGAEERRRVQRLAQGAAAVRGGRGVGVVRGGCRGEVRADGEARAAGEVGGAEARQRGQCASEGWVC